MVLQFGWRRFDEVRQIAFVADHLNTARRLGLVRGQATTRARHSLPAHRAGVWLENRPLDDFSCRLTPTGSCAALKAEGPTVPVEPSGLPCIGADLSWFVG
jgi:hypothetical protein